MGLRDKTQQEQLQDIYNEEINSEVEAFNAPADPELQVPLEDARDTLAELQEVNIPEVPTETIQEPIQLSPQQQLLEEYKKRKQEIQQQREAGIDSARNVDMLEGILKSVQMMTTGAAGAKTGFHVPSKADAINLKAFSQSAKDRSNLSPDPLNELMAQYKLSQLGKGKELTPYQKESLEVMKKNLELRAKSIDDTNERQKFSVKVREELKAKDRAIKADNRIYKVTEDFEKHNLKKELDKQGLAFDQAGQLMKQMESGNQVALGALGTKMARAMGEVGVLTDTDVTRYVRAQSAIRGATDAAGKILWGSLSKETLKDLKDINAKMKQGFQSKASKIYERYVEKAYQNYGKQAGLTKEEIEGRFGLKKSDFSSSTKKDKKDPIIAKYAEKYNQPYAVAERALKRQGYVPK